MPLYRISGVSNESSTIYIIQNEEYVGKKSVSVGSYEILFNAESASNIVAVAENPQGQIVGFGDVIVVETTGVEPNIHKCSVMEEIVHSLSNIKNDLQSIPNVSNDILKDFDDVILKLKSI